MNQPNPAQQSDGRTNVPPLLPCPFCGGKPVAMFNSVVECRNCPSAPYAGYPSADFQTWNRRAPEAARELTAAQGVSDVDVLAELIAAVEQYLTTRIPSYERISKAFKAWKSANG